MTDMQVDLLCVTGAGWVCGRKPGPGSEGA